MKNTVHFSKLFLPLAILSILIIACGIVCVCTRGINYGIDFKPGLVQEVRIAPTAIDVTYDGFSTVSLSTGTAGVTVVVNGSGAENTTVNLYYGQYSSVADMVNGLNKIDGVSAKALVSGSTPSDGLFTNSEESSILSKTPYSLFRADENVTPIDDVRAALKNVSGIDVKATGSGSDTGYQIRIADDGSNSDARDAKKNEVLSALGKAFGKDKIAVIKTDFVGASFSQSLASSSVFLVVLTLGLIWLYAMFRFKWDMAFGAIIALIHDGCIIISFMAFTQMEFTTTSIAAILTIVGYSINATVVILDRVRENIVVKNLKSFKEILDVSLSETLSRTIISTLTTLFAVVSLFIFTTGTIKDFALALIVGLISGAYSSVFISSGFVCLCRKNWKPSDEVKQTVSFVQ